MSNRAETLNDKAWEKLFNRHNILNCINEIGFYEITSKQINEFREARLMTKFDHKSNLPTLFEKNNLSILPITRGSYVISNVEAYHDFEPPDMKLKQVNVPDYIHSINFEDITSEATAINAAYVSGILADFTGEEKLSPTVAGRMSSGKFDFDIYNTASQRLQNIAVENSQIEIDGGYEGLDALTLIEAKNSLSDNFLVRQLYYPFRLWREKVRKPVRTVFLIYTNGVFSLYEYIFHDPNNYNSLELVKQRNYTFEHEDIQLEEVVSLCNQVQLTEEPVGLPFPQANSFKKVINICELLNEREFLTREEITYNYDFDIRQTNYYTDACRYLGLVKKGRDQVGGIQYSLTDKGKNIFTSNFKNRNLTFAKYILEKRVFNKVLKRYLSKLELPSKEEIVEIMERSNLENINSKATLGRRASTVSGWINWILDLTR